MIYSLSTYHHFLCSNCYKYCLSVAELSVAFFVHRCTSIGCAGWTFYNLNTACILLGLLLHFTWSSFSALEEHPAHWQWCIFCAHIICIAPAGGNSETVRSHLPPRTKHENPLQMTLEYACWSSWSQLLLDEVLFWQLQQEEEEARAQTVASTLASNTCMWEDKMNLKLARLFRDFLQALS